MMKFVFFQQNYLVHINETTAVYKYLLDMRAALFVGPEEGNYFTVMHTFFFLILVPKVLNDC